MSLNAITAPTLSATNRSSRREICIWLFLIAFVWITAQPLLRIDGSALGGGLEDVSVARHLAADGHFRDPFGVPTGPTAHVPPAYPFLIATVLKFFGLNDAAVLALVLINAAMVGAMVSLLPVLSSSIYGTFKPGVICAILILVSSRVAVQWEAALSALLVVGASAAVFSCRRIASGLLSGLAFLTNPVSVLAIAPVAIGRGRRFAAAVLGIALGVTAPWIVRNWIVVGAPYFVRDNFGLELYVSNRDIAGPELVRNPALAIAHPATSPGEAELVRTLGERGYNQRRMGEALGWIESHFPQFLQLTAQRTIYYWLPPPREGWQSYGYWAITLLSIPGFWLGRKNRNSNVLVIASLMYSIPYAIVQADVRYRYATLWMQALAAGYVAAMLLSRSGPKTFTQSSNCQAVT